MKDTFGAIWIVIKALLGLGLVLWGAALLFQPEVLGRKAHLGKDEFVRLARTIDAAKIDPANQGKPVVVTGKLTAKGNVVDGPLGVKIPGVISAYRQVEMFQNDEIWQGSGDDERLVGHQQIWSEEPLLCPSSPNPPFPIGSIPFPPQSCKVGAFTIPKEMAADVEGQTPLLPKFKLPKDLAGLGEWDTEMQYLTLDRKLPGKVGNLRVRYLVLEPCEVTVLGVQQGDRIEPFIDMAGGTTYAIMKGRATPASVQQTAIAAAAPPGMGWPRFMATFPLLIGFGLLLSLKLGKGKGGTAGCLAILAVPLAMAAVHGFVWYVMPHLVI